SPYADEVYTDNLGSLIASKVGDSNGPKVMVAGHLDEVGFMVTRIDENGFIYFQTVGGWWSQVMVAQRVTVMSNDGDITGMIGSKAHHILSDEERKKPVDMKDMLIDIGATSKEEVIKYGNKTGVMVLQTYKIQ